MEPDEEPTQSNISGGRSAAVSLHKRKTGVVNYAEAENDSDSESEDDLFQKKPKAKAGGSKKKRRIPGFDSGTDDEFEDDDDDDLTRETGLISKIYVENFMSHKKFTVKFGKSVNFVTGPNGSGKSAIVAALQLCLGSRMTQTGRGSNMSSLIRQGSPGPAIVRVTLVNDGADAYRTDKYGNRIIIERKIIKGGGSTYKLLSSDGTVVENVDAKRQLDNILKTFSIHCENPCCILTQELSKRFIQGNEKDKYDFFLKATGLEMTWEELSIVRSQCTEMEEQIAIGERKLVGKADRFRLAAEEVEKFKQFDELLGKIKMCTAKQFWVDFHKALDVLNSLEKELQNKYVKNLHDAQAKLKDAEDEITAIEDFDAIEQQTKEKSDELKEAQLEFVEKESSFNEFKKCIPTMQSTVKAMEMDVKRNEDKLKDIQKTIENMRQSILNAARDNERNFHESILAISKSIESSEARLAELGGVFNDSSDKRDEINRRREDMIPEIRASEAKIRKLNEDIRGFSQQGQDKAAIFNPKMPEILQKMKTKKFKKKVLGPAGMFIKIREGCGEYALAVEQAIGQHTSTFLVSCIEDQRELSDLLRSCGREAEFNIRIELQQSKPRFSGSNINKIHGGMSAIEAITVEDDDIFNFIADRCRLDHVLLSPSEDDVERNFVVLDQRSRRRIFRDKISHVILKDGATIRYRDGNKAYESFKGHYRKALVGDMAAAIEALQEQLAYEQNRITEIRREQMRIESDLDRANQEVKQVETERQRITAQLRQDKRRKENLENDLASVQEAGRIDTSPLEEEERDLRSAIDDYKFKMSNAKVELDSAQVAAKEAQNEKNRTQTQVDKIKAALDVLNDRINRYLEQKQEIQKRVEKARRLVVEAERGVRDTELIIQDHQNKLTDKRLVAEEKTRKLLGVEWDGNDLELDRNDTFESLGKKIANYDRKLEEGKQSVGLGQRSRDQAYKNLDNAREDYDSHNHSLSVLKEQLEGLAKDVKARRKKWAFTRERSAGDVAAKFDYYLNKKGSSGTVDFDHSQKTLTLRCQVDNFDDNTQRDDVKQLSGGERSFTTLCLLLALGHVIDTPFRILDEYDVFMDEKVRDITLAQIRDHALDPAQNNKQFIVITPNSLRGVTTNNKVRIHKIRAPIRESAVGLKQTTLTPG